MEIVKALLGIVVGVGILILVIQFALPALLVIFAFIIIMGVIRSWTTAKNQKNYRRAYEERTTRNTQNTRNTSSRGTSYSNTSRNTNPDVIDAEFTEEEIVD